jgi:glucan phosphoethanolaminetransferase (alkaline phosphatase superfamily)
MDELADHLQDLTEENMNTNENMVSRLGEPNELADAAVLAYRQHGFFGRHPSAKFWVFAVSPLASLVALFVVAFGCMYGVFTLYEWLGINLHITQYDPAASLMMPYAMSFVMVILPGIAASLFYCKLAHRLGLGKKWVVLSCLMLAVVAITPIWSVKLSEVPGQSVLQCGIAFPQNLADFGHCLVSYFGKVQQLLQFLAPLVVGLWFLRQTRKQRMSENPPMRMAA